MVAATPSNQNIILYSPDTHHMVHIIRDRFRAPDKVYEDWIDFDLENDLEIKNRKILAFYLLEDSPSSIKMIVLFEKGVIASFKVPFR